MPPCNDKSSCIRVFLYIGIVFVAFALSAPIPKLITLAAPDISLSHKTPTYPPSQA